MTWSAEQIFGKQRDTGGSEEREERYRRTADQLIRDVVRWRTGRLCRLSRSGEVLAFQRVEWDEWPRMKARFTYRVVGGRVATTHTVQTVRDAPEGFEFSAGGVLYRLEVQQ